MKKSVRMITSFVLVAVMILSTTLFQTAFAASKLGKVRGIKTTANASKKTIKISWKKVKGAKGYVIYKNTKKNFKKVKGVTVKKTTKTFKKLTLGKTYYFKVQAFRTKKGKKEYGAAVTKKVKLVKVVPTTPATTPQAPATTVKPTTSPRPTVSLSDLDKKLGMSKKRVNSLNRSPITNYNYVLKFIDDFDGTSLNSSNWTIDTKNYNGSEEQKNIKENIVVEDGKLNIWAKWDGKGGVTGGAINSQYKQEFKYGRLEIYCRIPYSYGTWPAFWTMGTYQGWPWGGEIDIMEFVGGTDQWGNYRDDEYVCGLHWCHPDATANESDGDMYAYGKGHLTRGFANGGMTLDEDGKKTGAKMNDQWRVCGLEWNEKNMWIYCDDKVIGPIDITEESMVNAFHRAHYMILNFALGGSWAGTPNALKGTVLPQAFEIDWVKVWQ